MPLPAKPLKVLHVVLSLGVGGAEKLVYDMVRRLPSDEYSPSVCCLQLVGPLGEKLEEQGIPVYFRQRIPGFDWGLIAWLRGIIRRENIDVIHAHQYTPLFFSVMTALLSPRINLVYTEHGRLYPERRRFKRYLLNPLLAMRIDHIVSISDSTKQAMARYDNFPARRIQVIQNGVDFANLMPDFDILAKKGSLGVADHNPIVGTAARLDEIKNIPMMLRAFRLVLEAMPEARLLVAGRGPKEADLKKLAAELGISKEVIFIGLRYDLPEIYRLFDIFLLSSHTEGISITLLEAMASGIPTVTTAVGGNPEVVLPGETGYLVPANGEQEMAARILELLRDRGKRRRFGECGRSRAIERFAFDRMMESYQHLYLGKDQSRFGRDGSRKEERAHA